MNHRYDYRMLFGEVMVPVLDLSNETFFESEYDADTKTLLLQPPHPNDSF